MYKTCPVDKMYDKFVAAKKNNQTCFSEHVYRKKTCLWRPYLCDP